MDVTINFGTLTSIIQFISLLGGGIWFLVKNDQKVQLITQHLSKMEAQIEKLTMASTQIIRQDERIISMENRIQEMSNRVENLSNKIDLLPKARVSVKR